MDVVVVGGWMRGGDVGVLWVVGSKASWGREGREGGGSRRRG